MFARLEEVAIYDDDGQVDGMQFDGRERRIQEWRDRKEQEEYDALFKRLYQRNWVRESRTDPAKRERQREAERRHRGSGRKQQRMNELRREKYPASAVVWTLVIIEPPPVDYPSQKTLPAASIHHIVIGLNYVYAKCSLQVRERACVLAAGS